MTDPVSRLRALDRSITIEEAQCMVTMPGRPLASRRITRQLLKDLGFRQRWEDDGLSLAHRWCPPEPLPDVAFGPIDRKPRVAGSGFVATVIMAGLIILGASALAGLL